MKSVNLFWSAIIWNEGRKEKRHINTSAGNKCRKKVLIHLPFTEETWVPCPNDRSGGPARMIGQAGNPVRVTWIYSIRYIKYSK